MNEHGQLGHNDKEDKNVPQIVESVIDYSFKQVGTGAYHSAILEESGKLFICGNNSYGQIGNNYTEDILQPVVV
jgi:alpha-tubulin suppressor-like RCC1 family protein